MARLRGDVLPGDDEKFMPEGFETTRLGPVELMDKGWDEMVEDAERLVEEKNFGCPFLRV